MLSSSRRIGSLRTDSLDIMILETYLTKLNWHGYSTDNTSRLSRSQVIAHSSMSNVSNVSYKDWLMLLEKSGLKNKTSFAYSIIVRDSGRLASYMTDIITEDPTLTDKEVTQFVDLLQLSIEIGKIRVAKNYDGKRFSNGYSPDRLTNNFKSLIAIDKVRKNQRFQSLMQKLTSYLELYGYVQLADEFREAMKK